MLCCCRVPRRPTLAKEKDPYSMPRLVHIFSAVQSRATDHRSWRQSFCFCFCFCLSSSPNIHTTLSCPRALTSGRGMRHSSSSSMHGRVLMLVGVSHLAHPTRTSNKLARPISLASGYVSPDPRLGCLPAPSPWLVRSVPCSRTLVTHLYFNSTRSLPTVCLTAHLSRGIHRHNTNSREILS